MMKYQPVNHNFIPKDDKIKDHQPKNPPLNPVKENKEGDLIKEVTVQEESIKVNVEKEASLKEATTGEIPLQKKEFPQPQVEVMNVEEKIMMNNEIDYLREQLAHSEHQVSTLQDRLMESSRHIATLEEELRNYEINKNDLHHVSALNTNLSKLSAENEALKLEIKQQKEHVQMLYFILLILAIL